MATDVRWEPNPDALRAILSGGEATTAMREVAALAAQGVQHAMPEATGYNRRSISSTTEIEASGTDGYGAVGYVVTDSSVWHILEYGSVEQPPRRPFARGVKSVGLRYEATS